jgi:hypothetical protein
MKYATKLMVVPFVKKIEDPETKYVNDLDDGMSEILNNKSLSVTDKISRYNDLLNKFNEKRPPGESPFIHHASNLTEFNSEMNGQENFIDPDDEIIDRKIKKHFNENVDNFFKQFNVQKIKKKGGASTKKLVLNPISLQSNFITPTAQPIRTPKSILKSKVGFNLDDNKTKTDSETESPSEQSSGENSNKTFHSAINDSIIHLNLDDESYVNEEEKNNTPIPTNSKKSNKKKKTIIRRKLNRQNGETSESSTEDDYFNDPDYINLNQKPTGWESLKLPTRNIYTDRRRKPKPY